MFEINGLKERIKKYKYSSRKKSGDYVLYWLKQGFRTQDNYALSFAKYLSQEYQKPLLICYQIENDYPYASDRFYKFILESCCSLANELKDENLELILFVQKNRADDREINNLFQKAHTVITDEIPLKYHKDKNLEALKNLNANFFTVDNHCLVPMSLISDTDETRIFRRQHTPLREKFAGIELESFEYITNKFEFPNQINPLKLNNSKIMAIINQCQIDHSVKGSEYFIGSHKTAIEKLEYSLKENIPKYPNIRNNPAIKDSTTRLSPYIHFGLISVKEIYLKVVSLDISSFVKYKFFDQLLTWREFFFHICKNFEDEQDYQNIPDWAKETLDKHKDDQREMIYSNDDLINYQTYDEIWNLAQKQYTEDAWMHNNLRMYWGKKVIEWKESPELAWETIIMLNDKLSLDGQDPATYGSILWCFGRGARMASEKPIYGKVGRKSDKLIRKRLEIENK